MLIWNIFLAVYLEIVECRARITQRKMHFPFFSGDLLSALFHFFSSFESKCSLGGTECAQLSLLCRVAFCVVKERLASIWLISILWFKNSEIDLFALVSRMSQGSDLLFFRSSDDANESVSEQRSGRRHNNLWDHFIVVVVVESCAKRLWWSEWNAKWKKRIATTWIRNSRPCCS